MNIEVQTKDHGAVVYKGAKVPQRAWTGMALPIYEAAWNSTY